MTELEFISLLKDALERNVFSPDMIVAMAKLLSSNKNTSSPKTSKQKEKKLHPSALTESDNKNTEKEIA